MHKIEQLAKQLSELASQLEVCSNRYVELATAIENGLEGTYLTCYLNTTYQSFAVDLCFEDLQAPQFKQIFSTAEKAAQEYAERIGLLWSEVLKLAGSVQDAVRPVVDAQPDATEQVFKVDDDN